MVLGVKSECNINALFKIKTTLFFFFFSRVEVNMTVDHVREFIDATFIGRIV